jgi:hypothetical protein
MFLDIIYRPVLMKNNFLETGFCLRFQGKPTQLCQMIELVTVSGHLYQYHIGYTYRAQHKPSTRTKTKH